MEGSALEIPVVVRLSAGSWELTLVYQRGNGGWEKGSDS